MFLRRRFLSCTDEIYFQLAERIFQKLFDWILHLFSLSVRIYILEGSEDEYSIQIYLYRFSLANLGRCHVDTAEPLDTSHDVQRSMFSLTLHFCREGKAGRITLHPERVCVRSTTVSS